MDQVRVQWRAVVNSVMNLQFAQKRKNFSDLLLTDLSYSRTLLFGCNKAINPTIVPVETLFPAYIYAALV